MKQFYKKINASNLNYINIISVFCALVVPLLVTGPFLPDLMVSLLSSWFLYYSLRNKIYGIYRNPYFYTFIIFWLVCILSSLLSDNILFSLHSSLFYVRIGIFALLISYLIDQNKKILDYFYYALLITFSALIIDGYFQYFTEYNLFGYKIRDHYRVSSFFGNELILGSYLSRLFPLLFALFVARAKKHPLEVYAISILFILIDVLVFIAGERTSFVFLNLSTIFIVLFISRYKWLRLGVFIVSFIIITFLTLNDHRLYDRYVKSPLISMGLEKVSDEKKMFSQSHHSLIVTALNMFSDKPILGHGPRLFRIKCKDPKYAEGVNPCDVHPHNFYIQLLAETGIVGFSFLAGLFIYFLYLTIRHIIEYLKHSRIWLSDYQICLLAGLLITIWPITTNGNFFTNHLMLFYSLQIGFFKKKI
jgi:hypothetical protein